MITVQQTPSEQNAYIHQFFPRRAEAVIIAEVAAYMGMEGDAEADILYVFLHDVAEKDVCGMLTPYEEALLSLVFAMQANMNAVAASLLYTNDAGMCFEVHRPSQYGSVCDWSVRCAGFNDHGLDCDYMEIALRQFFKALKIALAA